MLGINNKLKILTFYPDEVKLYLLASNWAIISEEQAFVKRCGECGDDIGSRLVTARISDRLIRLCFLYENKYAPYSKWFGTAFKYLEIDQDISRNIKGALTADNLSERETFLVTAQKLVGDLHNKSGITEPVECVIQNYFGRNIKVIFTEKFADAIMEKLEHTTFKNIPLIGTFSQIGNLTTLSNNWNNAVKTKELYK